MTPQTEPQGQNQPMGRASIIGQLRFLLSERHTYHVVILFIAMCIGALLEMVGIASVPFFVSLLVAPNAEMTFLPFGLGELIASFLSKSDAVVYAALGLSVFFLAKNLYLAGVNFGTGRVLQNFSTAIACRLYEAYMHSSYELHLHRNPSESIRNLTSEIDQIRLLLRTSLQAFKEILVLVLIVALLVSAEPLASLSAVILLGTSAGVFFISVRKRLKTSGLRAVEFRKNQFQWINQGLGSITLAKLAGKEDFLVDGYSKQTSGKESELFVQTFFVSLPRLFLELAALFAIMIVAGSITIMGRDPSTLLPTLALLSISVVRMIPSLVAFTSVASQMQASKAALDAVCRDVSEFEAHRVSAETSKTSDQATDLNLPLNTIIRFKDVSFRFADAAKKALTNLNFEVKSGESIGVVGSSGSGKSTLVALILGLLAPTRGKVSVHRQTDSGQSNIGYVPQNIYLLDMPVKNNIAFGIADDQLDMAAVKTAAQIAQIDDFIEALPEGYDTQTGDRGARFSGGQIQRLGIARALYHNPQILVLDEATSALDGETENSLIDAIEGLKGDRTLIIVAHRLNTIRNCERVIKLDSGQMIADQSNEEFRKSLEA